MFITPKFYFVLLFVFLANRFNVLVFEPALAERFLMSFFAFFVDIYDSFAALYVH